MLQTGDTAESKNMFDLAKLAAYTKLLRSDEFLKYMQGRINYDISKIKQQYFNYIEEAEFGVKLLSRFNVEGKRILEIGSGAGILTSWMLLNGADITGIEPSALGFDFHNDIFSAIWDYFKLPADRIHDVIAEELDVNKLGKFDVIFSINVMEHIPPQNLALVFEKMSSVMADKGVMYHHCPNYIVPFEPHYGIPLVPFFPQITGKLKGVNKEGLWQSVNFITLPQVNRIARKLNLTVDFQKEVMAETFTRLDYDKEFAYRHPTLVKAYGIMKKTGIMSVLKAVPPVLCTPMTFSMSFKK